MNEVCQASFLQKVYAEDKCFVEEDDPTTTLESCGAVLTASVILKTSSSDAVSELTGLPVSFTEAVLDHLLLDY